MMNRIFLLDEDDVIQEGDWIRPLDLVYSGQSDYLHTENTYSGYPMNHTRWVDIRRAGFERWIGKFVRDLNVACEDWSRYELARGPMSDFHVLPETEKERKIRIEQEVLPLGKYKGKTLQFVREKDRAYYSWMMSEGLDEKWFDR